MACKCCRPCCCVNGKVSYGLSDAACHICRAHWETISATGQADCESQGVCTLAGTSVSSAGQADCESKHACTLNGVTVSSTDQADCESKTLGHCEANGATTADTEVDCAGGLCEANVGYFGSPHYVPAASQTACESTYDYCVVDVPGSADYSTQPVPMPESQCVSGSLPPALCEVVISGATSQGDCPDDFVYESAEGTCRSERCVDDCDACDALASSVGGTSLCINDDPVDTLGRQARCDAVASRTPHYAVWHAKQWIVDHYGVWNTGVWHAGNWIGVRHAECPYEQCVTYAHLVGVGASGGTYFEETIAVPEGYDTVVLCGSVDDDIKIDGAVIQDGLFTTAAYPTANPAHSVSYEFTPSGGSFTIAVKDNWGSIAAADLRICFYAAVGPASLSVGPGAELKKLLAKFGIHATPNCKCNKMARRMDEWGPDECLKHIEEIVDVMEEEARKRSLPFLRGIGRFMVRKAVRRARGQ